MVRTQGYSPQGGEISNGNQAGDPGVRLVMRRAARLLGGIIAVVSLAAPAAAWAQPDAADTPAVLTLDAQAGLDGWVDPARPVTIAASLAADALVVGTLEVSFGTTTSTAIEIPAGSVKEYVVEAPAPGRRRQMTVKVVDEAGTELASQQLQVRTLAEGVLVGAIDAGDIESRLRGATTTPTGAPVTTVALGASDIGPRLAPVSYLVVGSGALADLDASGRQSLTAWVKSGGRLLGPATELSAVAEIGSGEALAGAPVVVQRVGRGELGLVEDPEEVTVEQWSAVLRDRPSAAKIVDQSTQGWGSTLLAAASSAQEVSVPALPWLLAGIVVFIVLVGPVNFVILRAVGKPEWAWFTIPALSIVFLIAFWGVGRASLADFSATHGIVAIDDGSGARAEAGLMVQVESQGTHRLALPEGWVAAAPAGGMGAIETGTVGTGEVVFELDDLGVAATELSWSPDSVPLDVTTESGPGGIEFTITNRSDVPMWAWGVVVNGNPHLGKDGLAPGASGTLTVEPYRSMLASFYEPRISVALQRRGVSPDSGFPGYEVTMPLAANAELRLPELREAGTYAFAVTHEEVLDLDLDGRSGESAGSSLFVKAVDISGDEYVALGGVKPSILAVEGASSTERHGDDIYAYGADQVYLHYAVPGTAPASARITGILGFDIEEIFDWESGEFATYRMGDPIDTSRFVSAGGDVVLRARNTEENENFSDTSINLGRLALRWDEA